MADDISPEPEPLPEINKEEQRIPTDNERIEHLYEELGAIRAEIAELRSHTHADLAHSTHEHEQYASSEHKHELDPNAGSTHEADEHGESDSGTESEPTPTHWYFRKAKFPGR